MLWPVAVKGHMTPLLLLQLHITHLPDLGIRDMKLSRPLEEPSAIDLGKYQASRARSPFGTERRLRGGGITKLP